MVSVVREVGLRTQAVVLYGDLIIQASGLLLGLKRAQVPLQFIDHDENLPGVATVFGDPAVLGAPKQMLRVVRPDLPWRNLGSPVMLLGSAYDYF